MYEISWHSVLVEIIQYGTKWSDQHCHPLDSYYNRFNSQKVPCLQLLHFHPMFHVDIATLCSASGTNNLCTRTMTICVSISGGMSFVMSCECRAGSAKIDVMFLFHWQKITFLLNRHNCLVYRNQCDPDMCTQLSVLLTDAAHEDCSQQLWPSTNS